MTNEKTESDSDIRPYLTPLQKLPMELYEEIEPKLDSLWVGASYSNDALERGNCIIALLRVALDATRYIEALYSDSSECREAIRQIALRRHSFVQTYEFRFPLGISEEPKDGEGVGDKMRRGLTKEWHANSPFNNRKEWDDLGYAIDGFLSAVYRADRAMLTEPPSSLEFLVVVSRGFVAVPDDIRERLLVSENRKDARLWGRAFTDWYLSHRPWPYKGKKGDLSWPDSEDEISDPIHRAAYRAFMTRMKRNPNDKSPVVALRATATKRFKSLFSKSIT